MAGSTPVSVLSDSLRTGTVDRPVKFSLISSGSSGASEVVAGVSGRKIRVLAYTIVVAGIVDVKFQSDTTDLTGAMPFGAKAEGVSANWAPGGHFETAAGEALNISLSLTVNVRGHISYIEV